MPGYRTQTWLGIVSTAGIQRQHPAQQEGNHRLPARQKALTPHSVSSSQPPPARLSSCQRQ